MDTNTVAIVVAIVGVGVLWSVIGVVVALALLQGFSLMAPLVGVSPPLTKTFAKPETKSCNCLPKHATTSSS